jgi:restriction system protein
LEEMVAAAWDQADAAEVILTPRSEDLGRDVVATFKDVGKFRNVGTLRLLDRVKRYSPTNLVTAEHARALLGVVEADKATKVYLTTTSDFAPELHEDRLLKPYIGARLELVNRTRLLAWFEGLTKK